MYASHCRPRLNHVLVLEVIDLSTPDTVGGRATDKSRERNGLASTDHARLEIPSFEAAGGRRRRAGGPDLLGLAPIGHQNAMPLV